MRRKNKIINGVKFHGVIMDKNDRVPRKYVDDGEGFFYIPREDKTMEDIKKELLLKMAK